MWRYKLITAADTTVCNAPCRIKKVALYHTATTTAVIYDEADDTHTAGKKVWTLATKHDTHDVDAVTVVDIEILKDEIDFGDKGAFFNYGCAIDYDAGEVLVVYRY